MQPQCVDSIDICRFVALVTGALVRIIAHMTSEKEKKTSTLWEVEF